jgi:hypothetical protein
MNKKNTILTLAIAFCLVLVFAGNANAGPSEYYFDEFNNVNIEVVQLGAFNGNEWAVVAKVDLSGVPPEIGLGFSFYSRQYSDLCLHIVRDAGWLSHSWEGVWVGSGTEFVLSTSQLYMAIHPLWTTPPAVAITNDADPTSQ